MGLTLSRRSTNASPAWTATSRLGVAGVRMLPSAPGARSARTTARTVSAWDYLPHDLARSTAYRWGEDGLAGICDRYQILVFALALWNERDPILKERAFGLMPTEGNHGEDVKEYYFYLDSTPTHSYMKWLYKYPQRAFPYHQLIEENRRRQGRGREFELLDTGIFDDDRYFDVTVEYAKASAEDLVIRVTIENRGPDAAPIHLLPHLWFRNTWAWSEPPGPEPRIQPGPTGPGFVSLLADDRTATPPRNLLFEYRLGPRYLYVEAGGELLFTDNETNAQRASGAGSQSRISRPYVKDAFHRHVIDGEDATNPAQTRHEIVRPLPLSSFRPAVPSPSACASRLRCWMRPCATSTRCSGSVGPRPMSSTRRSIRRRPATMSGWCSDRRSPGCSGPSRSTSSM